MNTLFNLVLSFYVLLTPLYSVSAPPFPYKVEQPDGTKIPVRMFGHEYYSWMETEEGYVIDWVEDDERLGWYYSELDEDGRFSPTHIRVEYPAPHYLEIPKKLKETNPYVREIRHGDSQSPNYYNSNMQRSTETSLIKPLVFLVDFNDLPSGMPNRKYSKEQFNQLIFEPDLESDGSTIPSIYDMSVRDYFYEISNGKLEVYGDNESIVDWTPVGHDYSYYVDGKKGTGQAPDDINYAQSAAALVVEIAMDIESTFDFSNFDGDGDGNVDLIVLIVESWGNGDNDQFWPHMNTIPSSIIPDYIDIDNDGFLEFNGVAIKKYIVIPEQFHMNHFGVGENYIHPIGTICHEMGHVLGLPDLYDNSPIESRTGGIGEWGLMGSGNWQRQTSPAYMSAWSRYQLGFINPIIINNVLNVEDIILPAENGGEDSSAMILPMDSNLPQEYLIIENRQKIGSDKHLIESGLLVWHIDETILGMYPVMNSVNVNPEFYGVNLLQADGESDLYNYLGRADSKDPFPGSSGITSISDFSNPNTNTYSYDRDADGTVEQGGASGISISNIAENSDSSITFRVTNPNQQGTIIGYDEGGYGLYAWSDNDEDYQWVGIKYTPSDSVLFSGILTAIQPTSELSFVSDYSIKLWEGWNNNIPLNLLIRYNGVISWTPENDRNGGLIFKSFLKEEIILYPDENYYIEINYNGTEYINNFDYKAFSGYPVSNNSFYRSDETKQCNNFQFGDWNIRVVMSGDDDFEAMAIDIPAIPQKHEIYSNYPNPFNPVTTLSIYLANPSAVSYTVFDLRGRQIIHKESTLLGGGRHGFAVNMKQFSSGVYFYQFTINDQEYSPYKMLLIK